MADLPTYRRPTRFEELGSPVPRLVDARWLMRALRDNARATVKGDFLPWEPAGLLRRAATVIELHIVRGRP
jgi:hypothetical protein